MFDKEDSTKAIRILYYGGGWPTNIGNAFIDLGATAIIRAAAPNAQIGFASEMPRWFFGRGAKGSRKFRFWRVGGEPTMDNALDVASVTRCDLVIFAGMAMCEEFIKVNGPSVLALSRRGVPVFLLGTGALTYSEQEKSMFGDFLSQLNPIGFVSRDDESYEMFADFVDHAYRGIDCGFFVPDAYMPLPLVLSPYVVSTFDSVPEPEVDLNGRRLIRAHHDCWALPRRSYLRTHNTLISDIPHDYLALYANAEEVHSDRVHACVAALAYGRQVRFYHPTPRASLFDSVNAIGIKDTLVQLDMELLSKKKRAQVEFVKELVTTHVRNDNPT